MKGSDTLNRKKKCYIYTRVSTSIQVDGYSLDAQKDKLRKYAEYEGMEIVGEYSDEGYSGKNIQGRIDFQRMLKTLKTEKTMSSLFWCSSSPASVEMQQMF